MGGQGARTWGPVSADTVGGGAECAERGVMPTNHQLRVKEQTDTIADFFIRTTGAEIARSVGLDHTAGAFAGVDLAIEHYRDDLEPSVQMLLVHIERGCRAVIAGQQHIDPGSELTCRASGALGVVRHVGGIVRSYRTVLAGGNEDRVQWYCSRIRSEVSKLKVAVLGGFYGTAARPLPLSATEMVCELIDGRTMTPYRAIVTARSLGLLPEQP